NTIVNGYLSYVNTSDTGKNSTELSHALDLEQTALDSESSHPFYMNDPSLTDQDKQLYENGLLAQFHGTIARLDLLLGQPDSALRHFILAIQLGHAQDPDVVSAALHLTIAQAKSDPQIGQVMPILAMGASNDSLQQLVDEAYKQFDNPPVSLDQMHDMVRMMKQNMRQMAFCRHQYRAVAPGFVLPTLDKRITDSLPKGKIVVLDFWGTWCAPCVKTLPKLDSVYQAFKMNDDIRFYAIDCMEDTSSFEVLKPRVKEFLKNNNITIPVLFDTANAVVKSYGIIYYPTRIIIDKQGVIRVFEVGYPWENVTDNVTFQLNELIDDACNTHPH
ncbi:MAG TPA: TlpA disulfide reductase family protein, partial [Candidatus Kapabacteria bacterium]|nr:TlpA disulfide reductase family protein [Candidatus Kapabacteria bacterium]